MRLHTIEDDLQFFLQQLVCLLKLGATPHLFYCSTVRTVPYLQFAWHRYDARWYMYVRTCPRQRRVPIQGRQLLLVWFWPPRSFTDIHFTFSLQALSTYTTTLMSPFLPLRKINAIMTGIWYCIWTFFLLFWLNTRSWYKSMRGFMSYSKVQYMLLR